MTDLMNWLTENPDQANALAAVANVAVAFAATLIAAISIFFAARGLSLQRDHNRLSVVPVPFIALADFENHIRVKIRNDGIGPLLIKGITYSREGIKDEQADLVSYMPPLPITLHWSNFSSGYLRSVRPGDEVILLELEGDLENPEFVGFRDKCRRKLAKLEVSVDYTDVYGGAFPVVSRNLDWFGRRLASSRKA
jgi:hypothetical protein